MPIVYVIFWVAVIGIAVWAINTYVTFMAEPFKKIINVFAVVGTIIWLIFVVAGWLGVTSPFSFVPRLR